MHAQHLEAALVVLALAPVGDRRLAQMRHGDRELVGGEDRGRLVAVGRRLLAQRRLAAGERRLGAVLGQLPDEPADARSEAVAHAREVHAVVLHHVMEQRRGDHVLAVPGVMQKRGDIDGMVDRGAAGAERAGVDRDRCLVGGRQQRRAGDESGRGRGDGHRCDANKTAPKPTGRDVVVIASRRFRGTTEGRWPSDSTPRGRPATSSAAS